MENTELVAESKFELRGLITADVFKLLKIIGKMRLRPRITHVVKDETGKDVVKVKTQDEVGYELLFAFVENIHLAEKDVCDFLGDLAAITGEEFNKMKIEDTFEFISEFKKIPGLLNFFKTVGTIMKQK